MTIQHVHGLLAVTDVFRRDPAIGFTAQEQTHLGRLAVATARICQAPELATPTPRTLKEFDAALKALPPQFEWLDPLSRLGQWMSIAALCELAQVPDMAWLILCNVEAHLDETVVLEAGVESITEARALCWARRGRLLRMAGKLNEASVCYRKAQRLVRGAPCRDAAPQAAIGLVLTAVGRGNFPLADRLARGVLARRPRVSPMYQMQAYQMRTLTLRRMGRLLDALLHGWHAFDLLETSDPRGLEVLATMSEIAAAYGDWPAAHAGFQAVARASTSERVRVPALVGIVDGLRKIGTTSASEFRERAQPWIAELESVATKSFAPWDRAIAAGALAEAGLHLAELARADEWITIIEREGERYGFHEHRLRAEGLRTDLARFAKSATEGGRDRVHSVRDSGPVSQHAGRRASGQHPALKRLTAVADGIGCVR